MGRLRPNAACWLGLGVGFRLQKGLWKHFGSSGRSVCGADSPGYSPDKLCPVAGGAPSGAASQPVLWSLFLDLGSLALLASPPLRRAKPKRGAQGKGSVVEPESSLVCGASPGDPSRVLAEVLQGCEVFAEVCLPASLTDSQSIRNHNNEQRKPAFSPKVRACWRTACTAQGPLDKSSIVFSSKFL